MFDIADMTDEEIAAYMAKLKAESAGRKRRGRKPAPGVRKTYGIYLDVDLRSTIMEHLTTSKGGSFNKLVDRLLRAYCAEHEIELPVPTSS